MCHKICNAGWSHRDGENREEKKSEQKYNQLKVGEIQWTESANMHLSDRHSLRCTNIAIFDGFYGQ